MLLILGDPSDIGGDRDRRGDRDRLVVRYCDGREEERPLTEISDYVTERIPVPCGV